MALLLGKGVEGICNMEDVGEYISYRFGRWWQRRKQCMGSWLLDTGPPLWHCWTQYVAFN